MRLIISNPEVSTSTPNRIDIDARGLAIFTSGGESYIISQNGDGTLRIEAPSGELSMDIVSTHPKIAHVTARGSCRTCATRRTRGLEGPCDLCAPSAPQGARSGRGPRIVKSPKPRRVQCEKCDGTIEYEPEDMFRAPSIPGNADVGPLAVKCPKPRCGGQGYPR